MRIAAPGFRRGGMIGASRATDPQDYQRHEVFIDGKWTADAVYVDTEYDPFNALVILLLPRDRVVVRKVGE